MAFDENAAFFCIDDSDNALTVIMDRGLLGDFPKYAGKDPSHIASIIDAKHPHHWLVACHFVGHTIKNVKNPYAVFGFLKNQFSREQVNDFIGKLAKTLGGTESPIIDFPKPDRN
jgi:hypothetical protein